jgi:Na+-transporting methylmalonyl-CoA/oxaloacetate decarboxylase gamma subunit
MRLLAFTFDLSLIDEYAILITISGYCIVLLTLAVLAYLFTRIHTVQDYIARRKAAKSGSGTIPAEQASAVTGEENAAIGAALFLFFSEMHDEEKYVMTIRKVSRAYSPWSSKIYGIWNSIK